jgi:hypothetical protein
VFFDTTASVRNHPHVISAKTTMADSQRGIRRNRIAVQKDISIFVMKKFP